MNYLQNKCNISRHFLKTSLHYRVKHKSLKMLELLCQFSSVARSLTQNQHNSRLKTAQKPPKNFPENRPKSRQFSAHISPF